jgi:type I restriction enzyme S subunit
LIKVSPNGNLVAPNYLGEALSSKLTFEQLERVSRGGTMGVINLGLLSEILIPLPPLDEQEEILSFLKNKKTKIKVTQRNIDNQISLLNEYRTTLISAAVTGKIDVRSEQ